MDRVFGVEKSLKDDRGLLICVHGTFLLFFYIIIVVYDSIYDKRVQHYICSGMVAVLKVLSWLNCCTFPRITMIYVFIRHTGVGIN